VRAERLELLPRVVPDVEVLAPETLRHGLRESASAIAAMYGGDKGS
jgi:hypothetical protein